jgi:ribonuclease J
MSRKSHAPKADFVFLPLGGVGEIGMNLYLYGYGPEDAREWLIVDMGVTFGGEQEPGVDVILPDIRFIEEERHNIAGLLLTHAHEDHFGAVTDLWPALAGIPVYATPFTAEMLKAKLTEIGLVNGFPLQVIPMGDRRKIGPFDVELISMSHSIPEPSAVVIRTPLGAALHTGDWKLDDNPLTSAPTDAARLKALGNDGIAALICDSTNAIRDGVSPSEADVAVVLARLIREASRLRRQGCPRRRPRTRRRRPGHAPGDRGGAGDRLSRPQSQIPRRNRLRQAPAAQGRRFMHGEPG